MSANTMDLITLSRAKQNLPSVTDASQDTNLQTLVTAASKAVQRYCRRDFVVCSGDELWPSADLWCPNGNSTDPELNAMAGQGALNAVRGVFAELRMHTFELSGYQIDQRRGWLLRTVPYTDPELQQPDDLVWPAGI